MPELRKDPIVERWVIIVGDRAARPHDFHENAVRSAGTSCPFCAGHEHETPGELFALRESPDAPWRVRVVPNRYPALEGQGELSSRVSAEGEFYVRVPASGAHEVIIETPRHVSRVGELSLVELTEVLGVYRERLHYHRRQARFRHATIFKNVGAAGGASIEHAHSQVMVTPIVPTLVAEELAAAALFHRAQGRCIFCDLAERELAAGARIVADHDGFTAIAAFASRLPWETWVLPRRHAGDFDRLSDDELARLAVALHDTLAALEAVLEPVAYNLVLHTAPFDTSCAEHYHWHIEIIPRVTKTAGFEWGSGCYVNPLAPEVAAARLRDTRGSLQARRALSSAKTR
ncbi:MAG: galactose-1-phosphate uridylyltransferase [Pirellulales bacterium]|nr:galactose-1-phosphate uridylyltransferase [Pirellulales bacterium]